MIKNRNDDDREDNEDKMIDDERRAMFKIIHRGCSWLLIVFLANLLDEGIF